MELPLWTPEQLGEAIQIRPSTLIKWRRNGTGPRAVRISRRIYYLHHDVLDWLDSLPKAEGSPGRERRFGANRRYPVAGSVSDRPSRPPDAMTIQCSGCGVQGDGNGWADRDGKRFCVACSYTH